MSSMSRLGISRIAQRWCSLVAALLLGGVAFAQSTADRDPLGNRAQPPAIDQTRTPRDIADRHPPRDIDDPNPPRGTCCTAAWVGLGPYGGDVQDVAVSPLDANIVLAGVAPASGAAGNLYRSTDAGATWAIVAGVARSVYDIEFSPTGIVFIGTLDGVWKSTNAGASFTALALGIGVNDQVFEVAIDPNNEQTIWAGVADALGSQNKNVLVSTNGGTSWTNKTPPLSAAQNCRGIAVKPGDSNTVYAVFGGSFGGGQAWVSTNAGTTWTNRSAGLPANPLNDIVHDGTRVLLGGGQLFGSQNVGLYSSVNDGVSWTAIHDVTWPTQVVNDIQIDPTNTANIFLATPKGIFSSTNSGTSWSFGVGNTSSLSCNSVRHDTLNPSRLFAGASSTAVFRSLDAGASFVQSSVGIGQLNVFSVATNSLNPNEVAIAFQGLNDGGAYTSLDGGATWTLETGLPGTRWNTVAFSPAGVLHALSDGPSSIAPEGVYRRLGGVWTGIGPDQGTLFESELFALAFSPTDPSVLLSGGADFGVAGFEPTVWRYNGTTWTKVFEGTTGTEDSRSVQDIEVLADGTGQRLVASYTDFSGNQSGGALRSSDGGLTWVRSSTGLPTIRQGYSICRSPTDSDTVYYANGVSTGGLYKSVDGGASWASTGHVGNMRNVECDAYDDQIFYGIYFDGAKARISCDGGATFSAFDSGLTSAGFAQGLFYSAGGTPRLLIPTTTGIFATDACGAPTCPVQLPGCVNSDIAPPGGDCVVNLADLGALLSNYAPGVPGKTREQGDVFPPGGDGIVDLADLGQMLSDFNTDCR